MISKASIKLFNSLKMGKYRKQHGLFVAEGTKNVVDLTGSYIKTKALYATQEWIEKNKSQLDNIPVAIVDHKTIHKISFLKNPSEVFGVFHIPDQKEMEFQKISELVLMLDDIRDPGNLGTIIRTADWFGIKKIICSTTSADAYNPKVVQSSMGSIARVSVHYANLENLLKKKPDRLKVYAAMLDGKSLYHISSPENGIILIGNEAHGISESLHPYIDQKITIPVHQSAGQTAESLNASIATAIICFAFRKK